MQQIHISDRDAGQRLDKFLHKYLPLAPSSFFYKMLRKKNITLNGKKAEGKEKLTSGDMVALFLSDETILSFQKGIDTSEYESAYVKLKGITVVYEDEHIIIMNKPSGILSQKAKEGDLSVNEWLIGYLLQEGTLDKTVLSTFKPSICNRLDRNTVGLITGAKTLQGSQELNKLISSREVKKFYRLIV
ncbi:MAG: RluA family pseudouridine synthase, partial [Lachnospiraceae bacterium]|nr:RluA family pseudouridine synthase [Lachnospiraceae bacterium]